MTENTTLPDIPDLVQLAVDAAQDLKALDLKVLELAAVTDFTDYFLVMSGASGRQVQAIADAIDDRLRMQKVRPLHVEGVNQATWVLMDYGDFVVHIFDQEQRAFYALERLWGDAPDVTGPFTDGQHADGQHADGQHADGQHADDQHADGQLADGQEVAAGQEAGRSAAGDAV